MSGNVALFDFDPGNVLPPNPVEGPNDKETIANLLDYCRKLNGAVFDLITNMNTRATIGFDEVTDGTNTQYSNVDGVLTFTEGTNQTITLDPDAGTLTFASTAEGGSGNVTYRAAGGSPPADPASGDTWYVTADGGAYYKGFTYRYNGAAWEVVSDLLYSTTVSAGKIDLTGLFVGSLPIGYTDADVTADENQPSAWLNTKIEPGEVRITSGGDTVLLDTLMKDHAQWSNDNPSGLYLTTTYLGFFNTTTNTWPARIGNDGKFYFGGDADNYIEWDGSEITVKCEKGFIGSGNDYFDITNGVLSITGSIADRYLQVDEDGVIISLEPNGAGTVLINLGATDNGTGLLLREYGAREAIIELQDTSGAELIKMVVADDDSIFILESEDEAHQIIHEYGDPAGIYEIKGYDLDNCTLTDTEFEWAYSSGSIYVTMVIADGGFIGYYESGSAPEKVGAERIFVLGQTADNGTSLFTGVRAGYALGLVSEAGLRFVALHSEGRFGELTDCEITYSSSTPAYGARVPPACLHFAGNGSVAGAYYDSGWVEVTAASTEVFTHGLASTPQSYQVYIRSGTDQTMGGMDLTPADHNYGCWVCFVDSTYIKVRIGDTAGLRMKDDGGVNLVVANPEIKVLVWS